METGMFFLIQVKGVIGQTDYLLGCWLSYPQTWTSSETRKAEFSFQNVAAF